jgi:polygalacturonase
MKSPRLVRISRTVCLATFFCLVPWFCSPATAAVDAAPSQFSGYKSIREFGVVPTNTAAANRAALQQAIDWAAPRGAALFVEPSDEPYPVAGGLVLRMNVSLVGVHGPVGRGTRHPDNLALSC